MKDHLRTLLTLLFPYRSHLESEIEYLKEQLAQKQRRIDVLQDKLVERAQPSPKVQYVQKPDGKLAPVHPKGWDEVRAYRRANPEQEQEQGKNEPA